jgi:hypothetical protein
VWAAIQDTNEPSSDRLIEEGRPLMRRPSFFVLMTTGRTIKMGCHPCLGVQFPPIFQAGGCWLRKHRGDMPLDSPGPVAYFVPVI